LGSDNIRSRHLQPAFAELNPFAVTGRSATLGTLSLPLPEMTDASI
jgi:hypothetical protein